MKNLDKEKTNQVIQKEYLELSEEDILNIISGNYSKLKESRISNKLHTGWTS